MTWVKIDDQFADHPKILRAGPIAGWMHVAALCYANRHLTDGLIPRAALPTLASFDGVGLTREGQLIATPMRVDPADIAAILVAVGLWSEEADGYRIHDYLDFNPARADVEDHRAKVSAARSEAGKRSGFVRRSGAAKSGQSNTSGTKPEQKVIPVPVPVPVPGKDEDDEGTGVAARRTDEEKDEPRGRALTPAQEVKFVIEAVVDRWRELRRKHFGDRGHFTDPQAVAGLKKAVARALAAGCTAGDLSAGLLAHGDDPKGNPWYADEWANRERAIREEKQARTFKAQDRREADRVAQQADEARWQALEAEHPGMTRGEIAKLLFRRGFHHVGEAVEVVAGSVRS